MNKIKPVKLGDVTKMVWNLSRPRLLLFPQSVFILFILNGLELNERAAIANTGNN